MNVYVVSFDESENADNPLLSAYASRLAMVHAVERIAADSEFSAEIDEALDEGGDFTLMSYDPDTGERMQLHVREVRVERLENIISAEGIL